MCSDNNCNSCIGDILAKIIILQNKTSNGDCFAGCDKPYLGPITNIECYNTRPIQLYNCCTGEPWTFTVTGDAGDVTSNILRIESMDECCCTCRVLSSDAETGVITSTGQFCTIDLKCVGAIRCLPDANVDLC